MKETELADKLEKVLDGLEDTAHVELFNNEKWTGLDIRWSMKGFGFGFGQLLLSYDKEKNTWSSDTECMSDKSVTKILSIAAPQIAALLLELDK